MSWSLVVGLAAFLSFMFTSSFMRGRADRLLTPDQLNQVAAVQAMRKLIRLFMSLYAMVLFVTLIALHSPLGWFTLYVQVAVAVVLIVWSHVTYFRRLRALNLPPAYVSASQRARVIMYSGCIAGLAIVMSGGLVSG